jgi:probable F420-dependent oxidoreductase
MTMKVYNIPSQVDQGAARTAYRTLEDIGYDGAFTTETMHDPFITATLACEYTTTLRLGTSVAIAFARNPMTLANLGHDLQALSRGRFLLGLGSQIKPHIEKRFSAPWSRPAARMREMVLAIRAIWDCWDGKAPLDFHGSFYTHTLMTPVFNPGPNPFGPPPIFTGGFGPLMTAVAGEVADGFFIHGFASRRSIVENTLPALRKGLDKAGRERSDLEVIHVALVVTGDTEEAFARSKAAMKNALAFYGSTPAYLPTLQVHGWEGMQPELNRLSKEGRWDEMGGLIDDAMLEELSVVGERPQIAGKLRERFGDLVDGLILTHNRYPDPHHWADVVRDIKQEAAADGR